MANVFGLDTIDNLDVSTLYIDGVNVNNKFVSVADFTQSNTGNQLQLQNYVTTSALTTTLQGYQRTINSSNKVPYSFISSPPELSIYATNSVLAAYVTNTALQASLVSYQ